MMNRTLVPRDSSRAQTSLHAHGLVVLSVFTAITLCGCKRSSGRSSTWAAPPINVQVVHPTQGEVTRSITLPGNVMAYQQVTLYAKIAGYLKTIAVDKGDRVQQGAPLAEIEVPEMLAELARYKADVKVTEIDYQRVSAAQGKAPDLVVPQTVDSAKAHYEVAKANLERVETLLNYTHVTAPFSAIISRRWVDPGAFIPAATSSSAAQNAALLTLVDYSTVRIQVSVPEPEVPFIVEGVPASISVEELADRRFEGKVTRYAHTLDEATKTMLTEIEMPNPTGALRPGMYATVKLELERKRDALTIPSEAVVIEKNKTSVFTVVENKARKVVVKIGFNDGIRAELLDGVGTGQPVVLLGRQLVADGQAVTVVEAK